MNKDRRSRLPTPIDEDARLKEKPTESKHAYKNFFFSQDPFRTYLIPRPLLLELIESLTTEIKARGVLSPYILLSFRPDSSNDELKRVIARIFPINEKPLTGDDLYRELRLVDVYTLASVLKWCWCRMPGGVVTWKCYRKFRVDEAETGYRTDAFGTIIPRCIETEAHAKIVYNFFDLMASIATHGRRNGLGARKLCRLAGFWAFDITSKHTFASGLSNWSAAAEATNHLFTAFLRLMEPPDIPGTLTNPSGMPKPLYDFLKHSKSYPPKPRWESRLIAVPIVTLEVSRLSSNPLVLLRRVARTLRFDNPELFISEDDFNTLYFLFNDPNSIEMKASTESLRIIKEMTRENNIFKDHKLHIRDPNPVSDLRGKTWSNFYNHAHIDPGTGEVSSPLQNYSYDQEEFDDVLNCKVPSSMNYTLPYPGDGPKLRSRRQEPKHELQDKDRSVTAKVTQIAIDDFFVWVWMSSLSMEQTELRKSFFGRSVVVELEVEPGERGKRWVIVEEVWKEKLPPLEEIADVKAPKPDKYDHPKFKEVVIEPEPKLKKKKATGKRKPVPPPKPVPPMPDYEKLVEAQFRKYLPVFMQQQQQQQQPLPPPPPPAVPTPPPPPAKMVSTVVQTDMNVNVGIQTDAPHAEEVAKQVQTTTTREVQTTPRIAPAIMGEFEVPTPIATPPVALTPTPPPAAPSPITSEQLHKPLPVRPYQVRPMARPLEPPHQRQKTLLRHDDTAMAQPLSGHLKESGEVVNDNGVRPVENYPDAVMDYTNDDASSITEFHTPSPGDDMEEEEEADDDDDDSDRIPTYAGHGGASPLMTVFSGKREKANRSVSASVVENKSMPRKEQRRYSDVLEHPEEHEFEAQEQKRLEAIEREREEYPAPRQTQYPSAFNKTEYDLGNGSDLIGDFGLSDVQLERELSLGGSIQGDYEDHLQRDMEAPVTFNRSETQQDLDSHTNNPADEYYARAEAEGTYPLTPPVSSGQNRGITEALSTPKEMTAAVSPSLDKPLPMPPGSELHERSITPSVPQHVGNGGSSESIDQIAPAWQQTAASPERPKLNPYGSLNSLPPHLAHSPPRSTSSSIKRKPVGSPNTDKNEEVFEPQQNEDGARVQERTLSPEDQNLANDVPSHPEHSDLEPLAHRPRYRGPPPMHPGPPMNHGPQQPRFDAYGNPIPPPGMKRARQRAHTLDQGGAPPPLHLDPGDERIYYQQPAPPHHPNQHPARSMSPSGSTASSGYFYPPRRGHANDLDMYGIPPPGQSRGRMSHGQARSVSEQYSREFSPPVSQYGGGGMPPRRAPIAKPLNHSLSPSRARRDLRNNLDSFEAPGFGREDGQGPFPPRQRGPPPPRGPLPSGNRMRRGPPPPSQNEDYYYNENYPPPPAPPYGRGGGGPPPPPNMYGPLPPHGRPRAMSSQERMYRPPMREMSPSYNRRPMHSPRHSPAHSPMHSPAAKASLASDVPPPMSLDEAIGAPYPSTYHGSTSQQRVNTPPATLAPPSAPKVGERKSVSFGGSTSDISRASNSNAVRPSLPASEVKKELEIKAPPSEPHGLPSVAHTEDTTSSRPKSIDKPLPLDPKWKEVRENLIAMREKNKEKNVPAVIDTLHATEAVKPENYLDAAVNTMRRPSLNTGEHCTNIVVKDGAEVASVYSDEGRQGINTPLSPFYNDREDYFQGGPSHRPPSRAVSQESLGRTRRGRRRSSGMSVMSNESRARLPSPKLNKFDPHNEESVYRAARMGHFDSPPPHSEDALKKKELKGKKRASNPILPSQRKEVSPSKSAKRVSVDVEPTYVESSSNSSRPYQGMFEDYQPSAAAYNVFNDNDRMIGNEIASKAAADKAMKDHQDKVSRFSVQGLMGAMKKK